MALTAPDVAHALGELPPGDDLAFFALLRRWRDYLEVRGRSEKTIKCYVRALNSFISEQALDRTNPPTDLRHLTEDDIVVALAKKDPRGGAAMMKLRALKSFYRFCERRGHVGQDPTHYLSVSKPKYGPAPALSPEELEAVLGAAEQVDRRARWALQLAYATAARVESLCAVTPEDIQVGRNGRRWVYFRVAKNDDPYDVPLGELGEEAVDELLKLLHWKPKHAAHRRPTLVGVGEGTIWGWASRAGELAGVKTWPHLLRHTTITDLAANPEVTARSIQEFANWHDLGMLRRYARRSDPNLQLAADSLHVSWTSSAGEGQTRALKQGRDDHDRRTVTGLDSRRGRGSGAGRVSE